MEVMGFCKEHTEHVCNIGKLRKGVDDLETTCERLEKGMSTLSTKMDALVNNALNKPSWAILAVVSFLTTVCGVLLTYVFKTCGG